MGERTANRDNGITRVLYCAIGYAVQVGTSPAIGAGPVLIRITPSVTIQKLRTPVVLYVSGAELETNCTLGVPAAPADKNWYPLFVPLARTTSSRQALELVGPPLQLVAPGPRLESAAA